MTNWEDGFINFMIYKNENYFLYENIRYYYIRNNHCVFKLYINFE